MSAPTVSIGVDYAQTKDEILLFLQKHQHTLEEMAHQSHVLIDMALLPDTLSEQVERNTRTFTQLFYTCLDTLLPPAAAPTDDASPLQVLLHHRKLRNDTQDRQQYPPALTRTYTLGFKPRESLPEISVRQITAESVGKMVRIKGMVTRVSNVKPLAVVAAYHCDKCASEVFQDVAAESWTPLVTCPSEKCRINNTKGKLFMETRGCKFVRFQEMKIQELTDQVPIGHIPRYMTVYLTDDMTRKASPGETIVVSGVILPVPFTGYKAMRAGLITDTYLDAHHIVQTRKQYANMEPTPLLDQAVRDIIEMDGAYDKLASSIAPEIYGHHDVKKALLLMLVGGTSKETGDGMKVRGDINLCLMGDPGVAKSQLLKYISKIAPRAVYTTGRGSSGVGLTASVTRDPVTEEMVLEGGALVLADNGIACIDEFDKMDESDRTAIHEVMEQQTISISKVFFYYIGWNHNDS